VGEAAVALEGVHVDIRVERLIIQRQARADLEHHRLALAAILQVMAVGDAGREAGAVSRPQEFLASIGDQYHFARDD